MANDRVQPGRPIESLPVRHMPLAPLATHLMYPPTPPLDILVTDNALMVELVLCPPKPLLQSVDLLL